MVQPVTDSSAPRRFDDTVLSVTSHRPWPMPRSPWVMTQTWLDLLFAHWRVDVLQLRRRVPEPLDIDTFDGQAWLGIVPFCMANVAPRGVPSLPWLSAFPELNVRTYVRHRGRGGVYFFSLDATNPVVVRVARTLFRLPYFTASMQVDRGDSGWVSYASQRKDRRGAAARFAARYRPVTVPAAPARATLEEFLTERYCLFTVDRRQTVHSVDIHHPPWPLQAAEGEISVNTMAAAAGLALPPERPLLHFSKRQDVVAWRPRPESFSRVRAPER